ncbi:hypothetical protein BJY00DRAFT_219999 [Aspergillus carlsbadensis]|nr:hypothetical protein BJY00DRAFT_219999 [Aspergillus carlsbadensis]
MYTVLLVCTLAIPFLGCIIISLLVPYNDHFSCLTYKAIFEPQHCLDLTLCTSKLENSLDSQETIAKYFIYPQDHEKSGM